MVAVVTLLPVVPSSLRGAESSRFDLNGFAAYAQLRLPQVAEAFAHLGFPDCFGWSSRGPKLLGMVVALVLLMARAGS
jgi:hypothetical protein